MKKIFIVLLLLSTNVNAESWITHCDTLKEIDAWGTGSDQYGLRAKPETLANSNCISGFYVQHTADNKEYVYSTLLTAFSTGKTACIQFKASENINGEICRINRVTLRH